jgi:hypothetical protein
MKASLLTFEHQDGPMAFPVRRAVYSATPDGAFSCSIECEGNEAHSFTSEPAFCFMRHPIAGATLEAGQVLRNSYRQGDRDDFDLPSTHLHAGSHFDPWDASVEILSVDGSSIEACISFLTDDPNYYDDRAKATRCRCNVRLDRVPAQDVLDLM